MDLTAFSRLLAASTIHRARLFNSPGAGAAMTSMLADPASHAVLQQTCIVDLDLGGCGLDKRFEKWKELLFGGRLLPHLTYFHIAQRADATVGVSQVGAKALPEADIAGSWRQH